MKRFLFSGAAVLMLVLTWCSSQSTQACTNGYFCAYFCYGSVGGVYYYYAPHCEGAMTPISLGSTNPGPPDNECQNDPPTNDLCVYDGISRPTGNDGPGYFASRDLRLRKKLVPGSRAKTPAKNSDISVQQVGGDDKNKPDFVNFTFQLAGGRSQKIVAQLQQFDIHPKRQDLKPVRFSIGQEVEFLPDGAKPVPVKHVESTGASHVVLVTVSHGSSDVVYQIVLADRN